MSTEKTPVLQTLVGGVIVVGFLLLSMMPYVLVVAILIGLVRWVWS